MATCSSLMGDGGELRRKFEAARRASAENGAAEMPAADPFKARIDRANIPPRYRNADVSSCRAEIRDYVNGYGPGTTGGLMLAGNSGTGKTYDACAVLNACARRIPADRPGSVLFATMQEIAGAVRGTYAGEGTEARVMQHFANVHLLLLDDMAKERPTEWGASLVYDVIDTRYRRMLPTVVTTNYDSRGLMERYSAVYGEENAAAILSRIAEMCRPVRYDGPDRRLHKAQ